MNNVWLFATIFREVRESYSFTRYGLVKLWGLTPWYVSRLE